MKLPAFCLVQIVLSTLAFGAPISEPAAGQLESWVAIRQQRVDLLREEIQQADARIESRLEVVLGTLRSISDSRDSGRRVAGVKEETLKRLAKTIEYYDQKRRLFRQELLNPESVLSTADKRKLVAAFDARIEQRVQQILALQKSMPPDEARGHPEMHGACTKPPPHLEQ